jgi:hypothetical protein
VPPYPTPQISMLTPQLQLLIDIIIKASSIWHMNYWSGVKPVN